jgi:hypothetical protein
MRKIFVCFFITIASVCIGQNSLNKTIKKDSIAKYIGNGVYLTVTGCIGDESAQKITLYFTLTNPAKAHQKIKIDPWSDIPVGAYDADGNQFPFGAVSLANQNGFGQVESELPTGLMVKGFINFINVFNKPKQLAHITIPVSSGNWPSASDLLQEVVEIKNIKVNWDANAFPYEETIPSDKNINFLNSGFTKSFCNGLDFYFTGCHGDAAAQTATAYFIIANHNKVNQKITIDPYALKQAFAFDQVGNKFLFDNVTLVNEASEGVIETMLPTNLFVKGSITFKNVLPITGNLGIINFNVKTENLNGSGGEIEEAIQLNNVKINWSGFDNPNENFKIKKETPVVSAITKNEVTVVPNKIKTLSNDLDLVILKCEGDSVDQSVTLYYTISNKRKPHQSVNVKSLSSNPIIAFDSKGNQYKISTLKMEDENSSDEVSTILPTGLTANGSITFINVFPLVNDFALVKIPISSANNSGEDEEKTDHLFLKNIKIKWLRVKPKDDSENNNNKPIQYQRRRRN